MAQFYVGNLESVDRGTLDALQRLPDDFVILAEFRIPRTSRQVDFFVARLDQPMCNLFLLETKNEGRRLRGTADGVWEFEDGARIDAWLPYPAPNERDRNPLQQAINTSNTLKDYLISMQTILQDRDQPWQDPYENLTVFPRLVMPFAHPDNQLQTDRFAWRYDSHDELVDGLQRFRGRRPFTVSRGMLTRMADQLGLRPWNSPQREPDPGAGNHDLRRLASQIALLQRDVSEMKRDLADIRRMLQQQTGDRPPQYDRAPRYDAPRPGPAPLSAREMQAREASFDLLVETLEDMREDGISRIFPVVNDEIRDKFGELPNEDIPFEKFKDFLQEAQRRGRIRLVRIGPVDHLLLSDEPIQPYIEAVRNEAVVAAYDD